jgi:hypothetical protein
VIRRHWLSIFCNPTWLALFIMAVLCRQFLPDLLRETWPSLRSLLPHGMHLSVAESILSLGIIWLFILAFMNLLGAVGWWYVTRIVLDDVTLTVRMPLSSNSIPLAAIQDVQTARPMLGLLFNYGTLIILSGNETENIDYVPDVMSVAQSLYRRKT